MKLDRSNEVVNEIFRYMDGETSLDACIGLIAQYEQKWDLLHIAPTLEMRPRAEASGSETITPAEWKHIVNIPDEAEDLWQTFVFQRYFGFLTDTNLVFQSMAYDASFSLIFSNTHCLDATARAWGAIYAEWANQVKWFDKDDWEYAHFTATDIASDYWDWADTALEIIRAKTRRGFKPKGWG